MQHLLDSPKILSLHIMNPQSSSWFFFLHPLFTINLLILIHAPNGTSDLQELYQSCGNKFSCGRITEIGYPFRGSNDPAYCGHPSFVLSCDDRTNVTTLDIKGTKYRVLEIDQNNDNMTIAREDIMEETCPRELVNTTLGHAIFDYGSSSKNFTFFYGCPGSDPPPGLTPVPCGGNQGAYVASGTFGPGFCNASVIVPGTGYEAQGGRVNARQLDEALQKGFEIKWQIGGESCRGCLASKGRCGNDLETYQTVCYCPHPPFISDTCKQSNDDSQTPDNNTSPSKGSPSPAAIIAGAILSIAGAIIFTIVIAFYLKTRSSPGDNKPPANNQDIENMLLQYGPLTPKRYRYSEIKKITKSFKDKLGQGGYGSVYKGMLPDGSPVAIKVLMEMDSDGEEFINEVASISRTSHVNVITLLGFCYKGSKRALVYEFMPNKSLDIFLRNSGSAADTVCSLNYKKLYNIALGIAKGLEYLHTGCNTRIVHFDIKPQNILLDEDFCPKISDFGLAKLCKKRQSILSVIGTRGTIGYIAPEMFSRNFGGVSHKSDVYSYGMMVLEMAGVKKIEADATPSSENYFPDKIYEHVVIGVTQNVDEFMSEDDKEIIKKMFLVGFWCMQTSPSDRPSMCKVVEMLEGSVQSIQIPPKPTLFSPAIPGQDISLPLSAYAETTNSDES